MRLTKKYPGGSATLDVAVFPEYAQETLNREISAFAPIKAAIERLAEYEDLEEAGRDYKAVLRTGIGGDNET